VQTEKPRDQKGDYILDTCSPKAHILFNGLEGNRTMGTRGQTFDLNTVTVLRSWAVATPEKRVALVLDIKDMGPIAFEVNSQVLAGLRDSLDAIEQMLAAPTGNA
jgi:hypothetical protein